MRRLNSETLSQFITSQNIAAKIVILPGNTPTVAAAAAVLGVMPEQIIKSVLFLADEEPVLVINNGLSRISWKKLADHLGISRRRVKTASAEQVQDITGYTVGSVPPFGHYQPLRTVVATAVYDQTEVYGGGGEIYALLRLTTAELQRVVGDAPISE
jgi:prolyl-tRNA editing enzyme YbaK/EbsC (Cys-tRNA(Pro) deacylase)